MIPDTIEECAKAKNLGTFEKRFVTTKPPSKEEGEGNRERQNVRQSKGERLASAWWKDNCEGRKRWQHEPPCENIRKSFDAVSSCEDRTQPCCCQKAR